MKEKDLFIMVLNGNKFVVSSIEECRTVVSFLFDNEYIGHMYRESKLPPSFNIKVLKPFYITINGGSNTAQLRLLATYFRWNRGRILIPISEMTVTEHTENFLLGESLLIGDEEMYERYSDGAKREREVSEKTI